MIPAITFGFILGIALGSFFHITFLYFAVFVAVLGLFYFYRFFLGDEDRRRLTVATFFLLGALVGISRISFSDLYTKSKLESFENKKVEIVGVVVSEPDVRENNTKLTIETEEIISDNIKNNIHEKILVTVPVYPEYSYGDRVKANVTLVKPKSFDSGDGRVFDYEGYLKVRGIWYTSRYTEAELISSGNGNVVKTLLFKIKKVFTNSIGNVLPEPESSLLSGLLLGTKQSLGKDILTEFQRTGTSHIVVLSGYNIAIVAESIMSTLNFFLKTEAGTSVQATFSLKMFRPKNISFGFGAVGIILFTILSGGGASANRAAIMVLVALFAKRSNREYKASKVLGLTIVLMLAPNPLLLIFDPSFQSSVLATIGLVFVSPILEPYFGWVPERFGFREIISTTISTQITVLPLLIFSTGIVSIVSLPVNILILGTIPLTMFLGFLTGIFGLISVYVAFIPAFFTYALLWYQLKIVHLGSSLSFGAVTLPAFSPIFLLIIYTGIFIGFYKIKRKN